MLTKNASDFRANVASQSINTINRCRLKPYQTQRSQQRAGNSQGGDRQWQPRICKKACEVDTQHGRSQFRRPQETLIFTLSMGQTEPFLNRPDASQVWPAWSSRPPPPTRWQRTNQLGLPSHLGPDWCRRDRGQNVEGLGLVQAHLEDPTLLLLFPSLLLLLQILCFLVACQHLHPLLHCCTAVWQRARGREWNQQKIRPKDSVQSRSRFEAQGSWRSAGGGALRTEGNEATGTRGEHSTLSKQMFAGWTRSVSLPVRGPDWIRQYSLSSQVIKEKRNAKLRRKGCGQQCI